MLLRQFVLSTAAQRQTTMAGDRWRQPRSSTATVVESPRQKS